MDRTNWQFSTTDINALVLGITYEGVAFPILFRLLPKRGNSNTTECIEIIDRFIRLLGKSCIESLVGDREFLREKWLTKEPKVQSTAVREMREEVKKLSTSTQ